MRLASTRIPWMAVAACVACGGGVPTTSPGPSGASATEAQPAGDPASEPRRLTVDMPQTTVAGHTLTAPAGWSVQVRGRAMVVTAPEEDSRVAFVDVQAGNAEQAIAAAWAEVGRAGLPPVEVTQEHPDRDGWTEIRSLGYQVPPAEKRDLFAEARRAGDGWLVVLGDMSNAVAQKRSAAIQLMLDGLLPRGYTPESFAGKTAHPLDPARIAQLTEFVESARVRLDIPGVSLGIVQDGEVVFLGGFGVRELGKPGRMNADTKVLIASNTKPLTTLMLAKLVDEKRLSWDSPAKDLLPSFGLGDAATTARVQVKHLVCACTGLPRQDLEWEFEYGNLTPRGVVELVAGMQPTSDFGELFQYSNTMAAVAGFVGGHVLFPDLELGEAYDRAMRSRVFGPLGMKSTTCDRKRAQRGNWARPHGMDPGGKPVVIPPTRMDPIGPVRPAGGAWSTARDLLAYVRMELAEGQLAGGERYIGKDALLARRAPQVAVGKDITYGMGLGVGKEAGVTLVYHGGGVPGYKTDMVWLPEHGVGAVVLTNGNSGWVFLGRFRRKLLEVLFDGKPRADAELTAAANNWNELIAAQFETLEMPADPDVVTTLAGAYHNPALGEITVRRTKGRTVFDFGEWQSEVASRKHTGGTVSMVTISPGYGWLDLEFEVGTAEGKRTLTLRDEQHEYVFVER